ncbi:unnamed protein product [Amoebophrya sp. A25]|nr:unnamed protein product [Amoebophrya sp. A25]|eukprot:GSA25T00016128001.1
MLGARPAQRHQQSMSAATLLGGFPPGPADHALSSSISSSISSSLASSPSLVPTGVSARNISAASLLLDEAASAVVQPQAVVANAAATLAANVLLQNQAAASPQISPALGPLGGNGAKPKGSFLGAGEDPLVAEALSSLFGTDTTSHMNKTDDHGPQGGRNVRSASVQDHSNRLALEQAAVGLAHQQAAAFALDSLLGGLDATAGVTETREGRANSREIERPPYQKGAAFHAGKNGDQGRRGATSGLSDRSGNGSNNMTAWLDEILTTQGAPGGASSKFIRPSPSERGGKDHHSSSTTRDHTLRSYPSGDYDHGRSAAGPYATTKVGSKSWGPRGGYKDSGSSSKSGSYGKDYHYSRGDPHYSSSGGPSSYHGKNRYHSKDHYQKGGKHEKGERDSHPPTVGGNRPTYSKYGSGGKHGDRSDNSYHSRYNANHHDQYKTSFGEHNSKGSASSSKQGHGADGSTGKDHYAPRDQPRDQHPGVSRHDSGSKPSDVAEQTGGDRGHQEATTTSRFHPSNSLTSKGNSPANHAGARAAPAFVTESSAAKSISETHPTSGPGSGGKDSTSPFAANKGDPQGEAHSMGGPGARHHGGTRGPHFPGTTAPPEKGPGSTKGGPGHHSHFNSGPPQPQAFNNYSHFGRSTPAPTGPPHISGYGNPPPNFVQSSDKNMKGGALKGGEAAPFKGGKAVGGKNAPCVSSNPNLQPLGSPPVIHNPLVGKGAPGPPSGEPLCTDGGHQSNVPGMSMLNSPNQTHPGEGAATGPSRAPHGSMMNYESLTGHSSGSSCGGGAGAPAGGGVHGTNSNISASPNCSTSGGGGSLSGGSPNLDLEDLTGGAVYRSSAPKKEGGVMSDNVHTSATVIGGGSGTTESRFNQDTANAACISSPPLNSAKHEASSHQSGGATAETAMFQDAKMSPDRVEKNAAILNTIDFALAGGDGSTRGQNYGSYPPGAERANINGVKGDSLNDGDPMNKGGSGGGWDTGSPGDGKGSGVIPMLDPNGFPSSCGLPPGGPPMQVGKAGSNYPVPPPFSNDFMMGGGMNMMGPPGAPPHATFQNTAPGGGAYNTGYPSMHPSAPAAPTMMPGGGFATGKDAFGGAKSGYGAPAPGPHGKKGRFSFGGGTKEGPQRWSLGGGKDGAKPGYGPPDLSGIKGPGKVPHAKFNANMQPIGASGGTSMHGHGKGDKNYDPVQQGMNYSVAAGPSASAEMKTSSGGDVDVDDDDYITSNQPQPAVVPEKQPAFSASNTDSFPGNLGRPQSRSRGGSRSGEGGGTNYPSNNPYHNDNYYDNAGGMCGESRRGRDRRRHRSRSSRSRGGGGRGSKHRDRRGSKDSRGSKHRDRRGYN